MSITNILAELNESNSSLHKIAVLNKHKDNAMLKRVLQMAYDTVLFTYGVTTAQIDKFTGTINKLQILEQALDKLESYFCTRKITGHAALQLAADILVNLPDEHADIVRKIINRDLRINCGKTQINKVFKNLITKPVYMRCDVYSTKTAKNIKFPAIVQLKADGLACFVHIDENKVTCYTRSGEEFILDSFQYLKENKELHGYTIQGELLLDGIAERSKGNGVVNSLIKFVQGNNKTLSIKEAKEIEDRLIYQTWDLLSSDDMFKAKNKMKDGTIYQNRFEKLCLLIG